jgi:hypothetical protein
MFKPTATRSYLAGIFSPFVCRSIQLSVTKVDHMRQHCWKLIQYRLCEYEDFLKAVRAYFLFETKTLSVFYWHTLCGHANIASAMPICLSVGNCKPKCLALPFNPKICWHIPKELSLNCGKFYCIGRQIRPTPCTPALTPESELSGNGVAISNSVAITRLCESSHMLRTYAVYTNCISVVSHSGICQCCIAKAEHLLHWGLTLQHLMPMRPNENRLYWAGQILMKIAHALHT